MAKKATTKKKTTAKKPARNATATIHVKRVYDEPTKSDGVRVLVDRLWPRGLTKDKAAVALWLKDAAPSNELRKWYHAIDEPAEPDFAEFTKRYRKELDRSSLDPVREALAAGGAVTLLFASKQTERNHAQILRDVLARG